MRGYEALADEKPGTAARPHEGTKSWLALDVTFYGDIDLALVKLVRRLNG